MKTKEQRYNELYSSGLVNSLKTIFNDRNDITEDYYVLMADYIDSMNEIKEQMLINPTEIARKMPELVKGIQDKALGGIYGRTDDGIITMEQSLNYEDKKLYFFHELTHALQTSNANGLEQCGFYNGHDGMFLTEGATQYTAEMLYNVSNGTNLEHREQPRTVRGANDRTPYSPLSEYQYNGNVLDLLAKSMDLPLPQVLALAYKKDGRETLKYLYEGMEGNQGKFDELMHNLEQIYSIDKLLIHGYGEQLQSQTPLNITMQDGVTRFQGNLYTYKELMNKTERELVATYMENHDTEYILQNYNEIAQFLTTPELKSNFISAIQQLNQEISQDNIVNLNDYRENATATNEFHSGMPNGYSINEFGEIIRAEQKQGERTTLEDDIPIFTPPTEIQSLSFKQKIAQILQRNKILMNFPFLKNFVDKQLNVLPSVTQSRTSTRSGIRQSFEDYVTRNGTLRNLPPIQRMSDPERIARMQREMNQQSNDERE